MLFIFENLVNLYLIENQKTFRNHGYLVVNLLITKKA